MKGRKQPGIVNHILNERLKKFSVLVDMDQANKLKSCHIPVLNIKSNTFLQIKGNKGINYSPSVEELHHKLKNMLLVTASSSP
jgi:hypothetical protein